MEFQSPSSSAPPQQWAMLSRVPQLSSIDLMVDSFSLAVAAPPDLSRLSISEVIARGRFSLDSSPFVLAADPSGLLLITDYYGRSRDPVADRPIYFVWDAAIDDTHRLRSHEESVSHSGNVGFIVIPTNIHQQDFMVVELLPVSAGENITILCYKSRSRLWDKKTLPFHMPHYPWSSANVISYKGKLWWVDLRHGILSCDPLSDTPKILFVPFPYGAASSTTPLMLRDISKHRCVNLSDDKLRFVEMTGSARIPGVTMWTLVDPEACTWELEYDVKLRDIWADESYEKTSLPKKRPVLAGVHPVDPAVLYFLDKGNLFGINLGTKKVDKCVVLFKPPSTQQGRDEECSRFLLSWNLPPSVTSASGQKHGKGSSAQMNVERPSTASALNMINSFMNAYTSAVGKKESDALARIAIVHLNRKRKKEENKFILSEHNLVCYFDQKMDKDKTSPPKEYAHMNFYVQRDSKAKRLRQLVFAEFVKDDIADVTFPWTLLSCKTLTENNPGGVYNTVGSGQTRKRSSCFACDSEIKHPSNGFVAGHMHAST